MERPSRSCVEESDVTPEKVFVREPNGDEEYSTRMSARDAPRPNEARATAICAELGPTVPSETEPEGSVASAAVVNVLESVIGEPAPSFTTTCA